MKQLLQDLKKGEILLEEISYPNCGKNEVLIKTERSLISPGTERMLLEFGRSSYLQKAKQQPDKVKMVIDKIKTDGLLPTLETVFAKLGEPMPLGYCNAGTVIEVGSNVTEFNIGDRVVSNGAHSEIVVVGKNLVAKIPDNVSFEQASFTVIASIALQGIRLFQPTLGEKVVVIGLGLIGQITLEFLKANGCEAIGIDIEQGKVDLAKSNGFIALNPANGENPLTFISKYTDEIGVDGVIITAATKSNGPLEQAAEITRKKGRIVAVGAIGMNIPRPPFYEKELSFYISSSYGPGRYDSKYENEGIDYPIGYVRWTENRNFQAILQLLSNGNLDFNYLVTHKYKFIDAPSAYNEILNNRDALGVILEYESKINIKMNKKVNLIQPLDVINSNEVSIGVIGAGNFTKLVVLPILKEANVKLIGISSSKGLSSALAAKKFGFEYSNTDYKELLNDSRINTIFITTRHNNHAKLVIESLEAGKNVFVEKPLAINISQLAEVIKCCNKLAKENRLPKLMVGFNRRFSPFIKDIYKKIKGRSSGLAMNMTINAGNLARDLWVHDPVIGGGRIIGEGCHFIDTMSFLASSEVESVSSVSLDNKKELAIKNDNVILNLRFKDGSIGTFSYLANGNKSYPKEQMSLFCEGKVFELDNYKKVNAYGSSGMKKLSQDKGHKTEILEFIENIKSSKESLISFNSLINTTLATFAHVKSLEENRIINIIELEDELNELIK
ncbi:dehydrogenase [Malaciobacter mytili]|uniref:bi-domain-containing oxidoreductase n=1 Tax=Malaciobacter mytili TaxID=603050 RepID=UPI00100A3AE6|nr:bi-domain-containing oxidoreductase [Malaciobacter mytili]RXI38898.1 dehydrogenase [Malaciobacter mytili]